jgi:uncharacterized protein YbjT (DUF2867 family)
MKVLATGATGAYAGLVVPAQVDHGIEVRAVVHDPTKAGIARAHGYAVTLSQGGVPVELTLTPGAPHEFDVIGYQSDAAHRAIASRIRVLQSL